MAFQILMVEDDRQIYEVVGDFLTDKSENKITVEFAEDGDKATEMLYEKEYDLVLLDVMLPGVSGFEICRFIRSNSICPIVFVTARGRQEDVLKGYELGADDYVVKPFSVAELYAKVNALLRRSKGMIKARKINCGQIYLNPLTLQVYVGDERKEITLAAKEYHLLKVLIEHVDETLSRDYLLTRIWGYDFDGNERVVDNHIKKVRKALGEYGKQIQTVFGRGYRMRA
ncbi:MAG: response regulator transcription factor [Lachnospiraceae bacterium]|nr:response regulator transcription factor [Lachnospiraceae bacterium]